MADPFRDIAAEAGKDDPQVGYWLREIDLAKKREKAWRKQAQRVTELYEGEKKQQNSFNILYSNTETLLPACYNQLPRPLVERRYKDSDPLGRASSLVGERTLSYLMDSPDGRYDSFSSLIEQAVLGALVPGRGVTRFSYEAEFEDQETALGGEDEAGGEADSSEGKAEGAPAAEGTKLFPEPAEAAEAGEQVVYETICGRDVDYDELLFGYSRTWKGVPWVAFAHDMTKDDAKANFGSAVAVKLKYSDPGKRDTDEWKSRKDEENEGAHNRGSDPTVLVYEIWSKRDKRVYFLAPDFKEGFLREPMRDPWKLSGFYPIPEPLQFLIRRSSLIPTPLYTLYEEQAKELNALTQRINRVLAAMKVRGFYDGTIQGLKELLSSDDNTLIAAKNVAAMQQGQTLEKSIWLMPLNELQAVLKQLFEGREQCKQTIYEITGIADIMRGQGEASETATAQNIKNQWGSLKMKRMQRYVQRYVRDCLRIMAELAAEHFDLETFVGMTNLDFATPQAIAQAQQMQMAVQQAQLQAPPAPQAPGGEGAPPAGPPPALQQAQQEVEKTLAKPRWEDVLALLRSDIQRGYKIDIETNSTIDATSQEDKQNINEILGTMSQAMNTFMPAVQGGVIPLPTFRELLLSVVRRFEFGRQVEEAVEEIPDQLPPPPPDPKIEAAQMKMEADREKAASDQQLAQQKMDLERQKGDLEMQRKQMELQFKEQELQLKLKGQEMELAMKERELRLDMRFKEMESQMNLRHELLSQSLMSGQPGAAKQSTGDLKKRADDEKSRAANEKRLAAQQNALVQSVAQGQAQIAQVLANLPKILEQIVAASSRPKQLQLTRGLDGKASGGMVIPQ